MAVPLNSLQVVLMDVPKKQLIIGAERFELEVEWPIRSGKASQVACLAQRISQLHLERQRRCSYSHTHHPFSCSGTSGRSNQSFGGCRGAP